MIQGDDSLLSAFSRAVEARSPGFDARRELAAFLTTVIGRDDYTWSRLNPRYLPAGVCLPSLSASPALMAGRRNGSGRETRRSPFKRSTLTTTQC